MLIVQIYTAGATYRTVFIRADLARSRGARHQGNSTEFTASVLLHQREPVTSAQGLVLRAVSLKARIVYS